MSLIVEITKRIPCAVTKPLVTKVARETLALSGYDFLEGKRVIVSIVFVDPKEIQKLNKTYRRKNKVTDVLSFPEYANKQAMLDETSETIVLGDLIVCYDYVEQSAYEDKVTLEREMAYIISHGILHLLGFRHSKKMFALQDSVSEEYV